jgi:NIPSNAP
MRFRTRLTLVLAISLSPVLAHSSPKDREMNEDRSSAASAQWLSPVVELRQYTLHPGQRDVLIELFEREFIESQEALGAKVIGEFRDLDNPDLFVWLRGFDDMPTRAQALTEFYGGPVWRANSKAANATMVDSDNVLLLRPVRPGQAFHLSPQTRPAQGALDVPGALIVATIYYLRASAAADYASWYEQSLQPVLREAGGTPLASFVTESSPNNFPRLPVREGENVFVAFTCFANAAAYEKHKAVLAGSASWRELSTQVASRSRNLPEVHRLNPGARSLLRGCTPGS